MAKSDDSLSDADAPFTSPTKARQTLEKAGRRRPARSPEVAERMVRAARLGLDFHYEQSALAELLRYIEELDRAIPKKFSKPKPVKTELTREANPTEHWVQAEALIALTRAQYDQLLTMATARQQARKTFGPGPGYSPLDPGAPAVDSLLQDRDAPQVLMAAYILKDAHDNGYAEPLPVELAYIAVVLGVDNAIKSNHDPDVGAKRRDRWGHSLKRGRQYAIQRAFIPA